MKAQMRQNDAELEDFERASVRAIVKDIRTLPRASSFSLPLAQKPRRLRCILKPPDEDQVCPITMDKITDFAKEYPYDYVDLRHRDYSVLRLPCKHEFAALPLIYYWAFDKNVRCPLCRSGPPNARLAKFLPECIETHILYRDLWSRTVEDRLYDHKLHFKLEGVGLPWQFVEVEYTELEGNVVLTAQGPEVERFLRVNKVIRLHIVLEQCYYEDLWLTHWFHARDERFQGPDFLYTVVDGKSIVFAVPLAAFWLAWFVHDRRMYTMEEPCYLPYTQEKSRLLDEARAVPPPPSD
jgi:hypothetical protein